MTTHFPGGAYDNKIYCKFSKKNIEKKLQNKTAFCEEFHLKCGQRQMLLGVVTELSEKNGADLFAEILEGIASLNVYLAIRARGSEKMQKLLKEFSLAHPGQVVILEDNEENIRKILAATDTSFFFSGKEGDTELIQAALSYASLPIAPELLSDFVQNYNPNQESGTGFLFENLDRWSAFAALVRAHENFRFPYDWKVIQKSAIEA